MKYDKVKDKFVKLLQKNQGQITRTCEAVGISRITYYDWREKYPDFALACDQIELKQTDTVKLKLLDNAVRHGNQRAIEYWLNNKSRGEFKKIERHELTGAEGEKIDFQITVENNGESTTEAE